jgi:hypothetical protein
MRLFHFSESSEIETFLPRAVQVPSQRPPGREWLNGPLVWAIDETHQPLYLFPRECPRILVWPTEKTTAEDLGRHWPLPRGRMLAFAEHAWRERIESGVLYRYELPADDFESLDDAGMWVSRSEVCPLRKARIGDLPSALGAEGVTLRFVERLSPLRVLWATSLHVSGVRLRNAVNWTG